jgi:hypothetical protein
MGLDNIVSLIVEWRQPVFELMEGCDGECLG